MTSPVKPDVRARDDIGPADWRRCPTSLALLDRWQRDFPFVAEPFAELGRALGLSPAQVLERYRAMHAAGALGRIGGVFSAGAGGAALLAAMAVPAQRIDEVAARVSAHPGVNHNYEREHRYNLWFVMTGRDAPAVERAMSGLEADTGLPALRLRMIRPYRIDLGFDLGGPTAALPPPPSEAGTAPPAAIPEADIGLAALVEEGLALVERPFDAWARASGRTLQAVLDTLREWQRRGVMRRFGTIVRHHELGFAANAMTVFDVPDERVDACGRMLAREPAVTLAYRRERAPEWPYNLYCMVHGRDRDTVHRVLRQAMARCALDDHPHAVLFSTRRFKQTGARRFRELPAPELAAPEGRHAHA